MISYKCRRCEYNFCSNDGMPYCPACFCESLEVVEDIKPKKEIILLQSHHIHPKFMDNPNGLGQQFTITKKDHDILHGKIMVWLWDCIRKEDKQKTINTIISKSKKFIGVDNDSKQTKR